MRYVVEYSYNIKVEAKDRPEAEEKANKRWDDIAPRTDEMNVVVDVEERKGDQSFIRLGKYRYRIKKRIKGLELEGGLVVDNVIDNEVAFFKSDRDDLEQHPDEAPVELASNEYIKLVRPPKL